MDKYHGFTFYLVNTQQYYWEIQNKTGNRLSGSNRFDNETEAMKWAISWASSWSTARVLIKDKDE